MPNRTDRTPVSSRLPGHPSSRGLALLLGAVLAILAAVNVAGTYGPPRTELVLGPLVALGLVLLARRAGLSWHDLGPSGRTFLSGLRYAAGAVLVVAVVYRFGAAVPLTRPAFHDGRHHLHPGAALLTAFIVVPLGTVLLEEIAFRGVLLGRIDRHRGAVCASVTSSVLFGLWHILPSLRLNHANQAVGAALGADVTGRVLTVLAAVGFTRWLACCCASLAAAAAACSPRPGCTGPPTAWVCWRAPLWEPCASPDVMVARTLRSTRCGPAADRPSGARRSARAWRPPRT
jgi:membrane protease YdiL (CAAX protease family)